MASSKTIETHSKGAEVFHGSAICKEKFQKALEEFVVPKCVLPVTEIEGAEIKEFGLNRSTGFFWLRQKRKTEIKLKKIGTIYYDVEIAGFIENKRIWKIAGVKGKEMLVSLPLCELLVGYPSAYKVKSFSTAGVYRVHNIADFLIAK